MWSGFLRPEKSYRPQPGLNPRTLDLEASTVPQDHRDQFAENIDFEKSRTNYVDLEQLQGLNNSDGDVSLCAHGGQ